MTDYSKPIRWECQCGDIWAKNTAYACTRCLTSVTTPVYPIIPEGERPEAEEPDGETVCAHSSPIGHYVVRGRRCISLDGNARAFGLGWAEPQAVLYVADGVLP